MVRQAPVICVMVPPIHLGAWSMALMLWLPFELLLLLGTHRARHEGSSTFSYNSLKRWGSPGIGEDSVCFCQGTAR